jgi:nicotinate-nucleotide adenylyltransferase
VNAQTQPSLIVFGGTFDPPHLGHVGILNAARAKFPEAIFTVVPTASPPSVGARTGKQPAAAFAQRMAMVRAAFPTSQYPNVMVSDIESRLPQPSYSARTIFALRDQNPTAKLGMLIGEDQLRQFSHWFSPRDLLAQCTLIVAARSQQDLGLADIRAAVGTLTANIAEVAPGWFLLPDINSAIVLLDCGVHPASSHVIRQAVSQNQPDALQWLPAAVATYIRENKIYLN